MAIKTHSKLEKKNTNTVKPFKGKDLITYLIVVVFFTVFQVLASTGTLKNSLKALLVPICVQVILAVSLNLVVGFLGELSLGHAGFMCVGAFTGTFFSVLMEDVITVVWVRFACAFVIGAIAAAISGILIGIPVLRLKGDYLAIVTLAFGEIIKTIVNALYIGKDSNGFHMSLDSSKLGMGTDGQIILNGPQGISGTPKNSTFLIGFILVMLVLIIVNNLMDSRTGRAIMSIRDNRIAAESVGIDITKYKLMVFTISAAMAGIAGVLYSHNLSKLTATTANFGYTMSITILVYVVLGGMGNVRGSVIAATILYALPELLRGIGDLSSYRMLIYSILLILMMIFNNGTYFVSLREEIAYKFKNKKTKTAGEAA
ncbi:MAG: branched-chain amino acid ABC transporter permease [Clostridia bacterium]|nr:branched-chain amino acid ABC transporter permease [Clostridia bacterium]